jgi:hypothetical protein
LGEAVVDLVSAAVEFGGCPEMTANDLGICLWAPVGEADPLPCTTFIPADRLDKWQRAYDRLKAGLPVPNSVWAGS